MARKHGAVDKKKRKSRLKMALIGGASIGLLAGAAYGAKKFNYIGAKPNYQLKALPATKLTKVSDFKKLKYKKPFKIKNLSDDFYNKAKHPAVIGTGLGASFGILSKTRKQDLDRKSSERIANVGRSTAWGAVLGGLLGAATNPNGFHFIPAAAGVGALAGLTYSTTSELKNSILARHKQNQSKSPKKK